jgi:D-alanine-D-alanine ligase
MHFQARPFKRESESTTMAAKKVKAPQAKAPHARQRTLGPVPDLERHLPSDWWRTLFNSIYLKTDGDVVENDRNTTQEVDAVINLGGLEPNDRILDLCCGQGRHSLELARRGFSQVTGLDRSRYLVRLARQRARKHNLSVTFREGDARKLFASGALFNCVLILGNSFGYFDRVEDDIAVMESCRRALTSTGTLILDIADGDWMRKNFEPRSWEWIDKNHFVCRERSLSEDQERLISREVVTHAERGVIIDQFYAERLYNEQSLRALLERAEFTAFRVHGEIQPESERGQDLGMMGQRLLITASAPKRVTVKKTDRASRPRVTVLMGDPRLPDEVKRDGKYNPEDLETVNRLKRALEELEGYDFEYLDNHAAMLNQLRSNPPEFALNLCDEGFNNDAFLELHVAAFLEMHGVPYSGAGPSCLGLCYNKSLVRAVATSLDIPVPLETYYAPADQTATLPSTFPALVKPNFGDSSLGITKDAVVHNTEELIEYMRSLKQGIADQPILIQEFLEGAEYSVGIIGNPGLTTHFLPILGVDFSDLPEGLPHILGYESKWHPESPYWNTIRCVRAKLPDEAGRSLIDQSMMLFERLQCRDYARFDYRADGNGQIKLLEVNPNPGWCWDGKLNYMAGFAGMRYADLLRLIIEVAYERISASSSATSIMLQQPCQIYRGASLPSRSELSNDGGTSSTGE